jgi:MSHA biogenesis protein MshJ
MREGARLAAQVDKQGAALQSIRAEVAVQAGLNVDPDADNRSRIAQLALQLRGLDDALRASRKELVPPERMTQVLERMLDRNRGLKVVALRTLPAAPLIERPATPSAEVPSQVTAAAPKGQATAQGSGADAGIYKHGVEITLEGSYADLLAYLDQLERLPTQMFWSKAVLNSADYPRVTLTLSIFTLSLEAAWLSV